MTKCPKKLKIKLDEYIHNDYHLDNEIWENGLFAIIYKYYDENPIPDECEWSDCNKRYKQYAVNGAGGITYSLCEDHLKWYNKHVKSFNILGE